MTGIGGWALGGGGLEQKGKRTHGHGQQCGDCLGKRSIGGLNGNGKNTIKSKLKKRIKAALNLKLHEALI